MKKYQLWLERKSYSQHLLNLIKIRSSSPTKHLQPSTPKPQRELSAVGKYKALEEFQEAAERLGDISYAITFKELKNRKIRLMRTFEIMNENVSMARRVKGVRSVFHPSPSQSNPRPNPRRLFEKKCEATNQQLRQKNFNNYLQLQRILTDIHPYRLTLIVLHTHLPHPADKFTAITCEIQAQNIKAQSQMVELQNFEENPLQKYVILRVYVSKGINSQLLGQFLLTRPQLGESNRSEYRSSSGKHVTISVQLSYSSCNYEKPFLSLK